VNFLNNGAIGNAVSNINNVVDSSTTISSLQYGNTAGSHTTLIASGQTLTVTGNVTVSTGTDNGSGQTVFATLTGPNGALVVNNTAAVIAIYQGAGTSGSQRATLDMSGLGLFNATISSLQVGVQGVTHPTGTLLLARTNIITASGSSGIQMGQASGDGTTLSSFIYLGLTNAIRANTISIGRGKGGYTNWMRFNSAFTNAGASANLRAANGTSRITTWEIGNSVTDSGSNDSIGVSDFSGGTLDALVSNLIIGRGQANNNSARKGEGTLTFTAGTIDATTVNLAQQVGIDTSFGIGTLNVLGTATLIVNSNFDIGEGTAANTKATVNIFGGAMRANSITNGASANTILALNNGTLIISNAVSLVVPNFRTTNSTLQFPVGNSGTNFLVTSLACGGISNTIKITSLPGIVNLPVTLRVMKYSSVSGSPNFVLGSLPSGSYAGYISNNTAAGAVDLVLTNGPTISQLRWNGATDANWNTTSVDWLDAGNASATYSDGSRVRFDDSATGSTSINLAATFSPNGITVSNSSLAYTFTGSGGLSGFTGLVKDGAGTVTIANTGNNNFTGAISNLLGTLQFGNGGTGGSIPSGVIVNNGTLVFNRSSNFIISNSIFGSGSLTKNGSGTLTLAGNATYAGTTTLSGGKLILNSRLASGSALTASSGTTLAGAGTNTGPVTVSGAMQPGDTNVAGTFTSGALTLNSGATLQFDVGGFSFVGPGPNGLNQVSDLLQVNGNLTLNNNSLAINLIDPPQIGKPYRIVNYTGSLSGTFNPSFTITGGSGYAAVLDYSTAGQINITFTNGPITSIPLTYPEGAGPATVSYGPDGKLVYTYEPNGDRIPDFSGAGYRGGGVAIPTNIPVVITLNPIGGDNRPQIQSAIDTLAAQPVGTNGFRGVILLKRGIYTMTGTINIDASGIVLRGEGSDTNGTILRRTDVNADIINISNGGGSSKISGSDRTIVNTYVPVGATWMALSDTSGYNVGDEVVISRPQTTPWVNYMGMGDPTVVAGGTGDWQSGDASMSWTRVITEIDGNRIRIDSPLTQAIERQWTTGTIYRQTSNARLTNCACEDLRGDAPTVGVDANGNTDGNFFTLGGVRNCWIRRCYNDKMRGHVVSCGGKWCTFEDIVSYHNFAPHSGASIQIFTGNGMDCILFHRITASSGGFEFTGGRQSPGPVVFSECQVPQGIAFSGPHLQWNIGYLWDELEMTHDIALIDQHGGWTSANHVVWNCESTANYTVQRPPGTHIWVQGCELNGSLTPVSGSAPRGAQPAEVLSLNTHLEPGSLYRAQLAERVGAQPALDVLGKPDGCNHYVLNSSAAAATVPPGQSANLMLTMTVEPDYRGSNVTFSAVGLPPGATAGFVPSSLGTNGVVTVTINTSNSTPSGIYNVKLVGTGTFAKFSGGNQTLAHPVFVQLNVTNAAGFTISATPDSQTVAAGNSTTYNVTITAPPGFNSNVVFSLDGLPPNSSYNFSPPSVIGAGNSTLTITTSNSTPQDDYSLTISGNSVGGSSGTSADLIVAPAPGTLPPPWVNGELGNPAITGQGTFSNGTFFVEGDGADIGGASDEGHFVYQPVSGDATVIARVVSMDNTGSGLAKAGVMIRETTNSNSSFADVVLTPSNGIFMQSRASTGATATNISGPAASAPYWVKLQRAGNNFTGFASSDGTNWTQIAATNIPMAADVLVGLVVTSHDVAQTNNAIFDNVNVIYPDFTIALSPASDSVTAGFGTVYTVTATAVNGFNGTVSLNEDDDIAVGGTAMLGTNLLAVPGSTTLNIGTSALTPPGNYTLTVTATSGNLSHNDTAQLAVANNIPAGTWTGLSPDDNNWSTSENWGNAQVPDATMNVKFFDLGAANVAGDVNNIVDSDFNVASLQFGNTNGFHTTQIAPGATLTVSGNTGANGYSFYVGTGTDNGSNQIVNATITGAGGTFVVSNSAATVNFAQGSSGTPINERATLDMSGLDIFSASLANFYIGNQPANDSAHPGRPTATVALAKTNSISLSGMLIVSQATSDGSTNGNILYLGQTNSILSNTNITSGGKGGTGNLVKFNPAFTNANPVAFFRAANGSSRVGLWAIGYATSSSANNDSFGTNDFTGGTVDALVDLMILGRGQAANNAGRGGSGTLTFNVGTFNVNTLLAGYQNPGNSSYAVGAVNVNGSGKLIVNNVIGLGFTGTSPGANTKGTLNISGGSVFANSITNGGSANSAITMSSGGTLVISNSIGAAGSAIPTFSTANSTIHLRLNGNSISTNIFATSFTASGASTITIDTVTNVGSTTTFPLISYASFTGTIGGNLSVTMPSGFSGTLTNNSALNQIDLIVNVAPTTPPRIATVTISGNNIVFTGTNGSIGGTFYLLMSTNVALPLNQWTRVATNQFNGSGNCIFSNAVGSNSLQQFYLLQLP